MFAALGIDLDPALQALRQELPIGPLPDSLIGPMATRMIQAGRSLGMDWQKLSDESRPHGKRGCG